MIKFIFISEKRKISKVGYLYVVKEARNYDKLATERSEHLIKSEARRIIDFNYNFTVEKKNLKRDQ